MTADTKCDVNSASAEELDAVPALAGHGFEIARYREERGGFTELGQLDKVPGLSGKLSDADRAGLTVYANVSPAT